MYAEPTPESRAESKPRSEAVIDAVCAHTGEDPLDIPPLFAAIDPDALDRLFAGRSSVALRFDFAGHSIHVTDMAVTVE